ncbi:VCBS repeat-containing protein [Aquimarina sediminis]|uniref:VCBS repeat-containing protein n=1 Tax=Aquimarina sediminis TaxID=2070536 RepID=UPI000CA01F66|nr:VCBS repeat-containing protein [Aquimarina sediminis]
MSKKLVYILSFVLLFSCNDRKNTLFYTVPFSKTNINFSNTLTATKDLNILDYLYYYNGGGVAIGDINNDGLPDIYFTGNQVKNKLYLNKGNFEFEDITKKAKVEGNSQWNTGVTMADVNADGLLDIYVCAVTGINGLQGHNELFINNGDLTFTEQSKEYQLDYQTYSTNASFFDYDNDGDLDMYLLNHAVHTEDSYGPSQLREKRNFKTGDRLLQNNTGKFKDVSEEAGIYGGLIGYGLGVCTADFNNDGYTDIYVSNDFHEDDYFYINQGDGKFKESLKTYFGHISRFSMGNDAGDINNDGYYDLITLDMLPEEEQVLKASVGEDNADIHDFKVDNLGYHYQYARNMLQLNTKGEYFSEIALLSGVEATDWSWSPLIADFNLDGEQDIMITNGIPKRPNDLDYIKYVSNKEINAKLNEPGIIDEKVLSKMPSGASFNYIFEGSDSLKFKDRSSLWFPEKKSFSNGSAYADLDNDGDLDIVINNINEAPFVYENTENSENHYLKVKLDYLDKNSFGIGTKMMVYHDDKIQSKQLFASKGFQSSSELVFHFGFQPSAKIDSILMVWPDQTFQKISITKLDTTLTIRPKKNREKVDYTKLFSKEKPLFLKTTNNFGIDYIHKENDFTDFNRQQLIPYKLSDKGPAVAIGDIDKDGDEDIFFGGAKGTLPIFYYQEQGVFKTKADTIFDRDASKEDVFAILENLDQKQGKDLLVISGGGEYFGKKEPLLDRLYTNDSKGNFIKKQSFPKYYENGSIVKTSDIDNDGDLDLFVGGYAVSNDFGNTPVSYLIENTASGFKIINNAELQKVGMVTDAVFSDYDNDGDSDLIIVGEWMSPVFFQNNSGVFTMVEVFNSKLNGLWQSIVPFDIDKDGDVDYIMGNWGKNSKFKASKNNPMLMYYGDLDKNGDTETIIAIHKNKKYYTINTFDELSGQLRFLKKKFVSYKSFAGKSIEEIFDKKELQQMSVLQVHELASGYLKNNKNGSFSFYPFDDKLQMAPITNMLVDDFTNDMVPEVLLVGNYFGVTPYQGRMDGFSGAVLFDDKTYKMGNEIGLDLYQKQVSGLHIIKIGGERHLLITQNNDSIALYKLNAN